MISARKTPVVLFWYRRDLRLKDNRGLSKALSSGFPVVPIFIFDMNILRPLSNKTDARVNFIYNQLVLIKSNLIQHGSDLLMLQGNPETVFKKLIQQYTVHAVYTNHDYEPYAIERDHLVSRLLRSYEIDFLSFKDQVIFEKNEVYKPNRTPYTMFTPYSKAWLKRLNAQDLKVEKINFNNFFQFSKKSKILSLSKIGFKKSDFKFPKSSLNKKVIQNYAKNKDVLALSGTTHLGLHLRFGTISIRECIKLAFKLNPVWLNELIWREFFMQILWNFPHVVHDPFKTRYQKIAWRNNKADFLKWTQGQTGYALVDAGIRQLNATGFMHNRARMITASFLVKHLLIDWRWGERYFANKLLDYDLSANNGNWQWVAGCGCDAAPYFRIFNPERQLEKFDRDLKYIKKWIPEYSSKHYPKKIVDHEFARNRCMKVYKEGLNQ